MGLSSGSDALDLGPAAAVSADVAIAGGAPHSSGMGYVNGATYADCSLDGGDLGERNTGCEEPMPMESE